MDLNMEVLIVDDFATMRRILKNFFVQIGFTNIKEAGNGKNVLKILKNQKIDLIMCDWSMPEMTGLDLLTAKRGNA